MFDQKKMESNCNTQSNDFVDGGEYNSDNESDGNRSGLKEQDTDSSDVSTLSTTNIEAIPKRPSLS